LHLVGILFPHINDDTGQNHIRIGNERLKIKKRGKLARGIIAKRHKTGAGCTGEQNRYTASTGKVMGQCAEQQQFAVRLE